jgi:hypothetical protein
MDMREKFQAAYVVIPGNKRGQRIGIVKYRESGYYQTDYDSAESLTLDDLERIVDDLNARLGIPADVSESMKYASIFGWQAPIADRAHHYFANDSNN